jgi:integrase
LFVALVYSWFYLVVAHGKRTAVGTIYRHSNGQWRARYSGPDRRQHTRHFDRKSDAAKWLAGVEVSRAKGEWLDPGRSSVTVADWCGTWLDAQHQLRATTRARYTGIVERHVVPAFGDWPVSELTPAEIAAWLGRLSASGLSAASVRYCHRVLSMALAFAVTDGRLSRNPAAGAKVPRAKARPKRHLTHDEVERLASECGDYAVLIYLLAYTGLRWGEAVALQVGDTDLMRRRVKVERAMAEVGGKAIFGPPKDYERREVPLPAFLIDDLAAHLAGRGLDELAFPSPCGTVLRNGNFRRNTFDTAAERAGLAGITPHGLRHTAASLAIVAGATVVVVQRMLGHSSPSVTLDVYSHLFADDLDTVAARLHEAKVGTTGYKVGTTEINSPVTMISRRGNKPF